MRTALHHPLFPEGKANGLPVSWGQGKSPTLSKNKLSSEACLSGRIRGEKNSLATAWNYWQRRRRRRKRKKLATGEKKYNRNIYKSELEERIAHAVKLSVN